TAIGRAARAAALGLLGAGLMFPLQAAAKTTVTIATYDQTYRMKILQDKLIPEWQKTHPDIEVKVIYLADFWAKLISMMSTGSAPDIVDTAGTQLFAHVTRGGAVDLAPFVKTYLDNGKDWFPSTLDEGRWPFPGGGQLYEVPYNVVGGVLFYNIDHFNNAGVSLPTDNWTWNDFAAAAKKLTQRDGSGKTTVWGTTISADNILYDPLARAFGDDVLSADRRKGNFSSAGSRAALDFLVGLARVDQSAAFPFVPFTSGNVAMAVRGSYMVKYPAWQGLSFKFDTAMVPKGPAKRSAYGGSNGWEVMQRPGQDLQAVFTILNALVSPDGMHALGDQYSMPTRRSLAAGWAQSGPVATLYKEAADFHDGDWTPDWSAWQSAAHGAINKALAGDISPTEALTQADQAVNAVLERAFPAQ
ncbi:MAG TPA: extracellular solute-binding protein, partial [Limnochordia bacterium]|nr:extracellular solute-binding protein [Limnochordia bacterium]